MKIHRHLFSWTAFRVFLFLFITSWHSFAMAEDIKLTSNIDHSTLKFSIPFLKISEVEGRFNLFNSKIIFNRNSKDIHSVEISIKAESIDTGNSKRDRHLKRQDFLHVKKYPEIYFKSNLIERHEQKFKIQGELTFKGRVIPMNLIANFIGEEKDTWEKENFFFEFQGETSRETLALTWNKTIQEGGFLIGEKIMFSGIVQAQKEGVKTAFSRFMIPDSKTIRQREKFARGEIEKLSQNKKIIDPKLEPSEKKDEKKAVESIESKTSFVSKNKSEVESGQSLIGIITYIIIGFYGFIGAIALAVTFQHFFKKKEFKNKKIGEILKESIADTTAILIIVPYAIAMWMYLVV